MSPLSAGKGKGGQFLLQSTASFVGQVAAQPLPDDPLSNFRSPMSGNALRAQPDLRKLTYASAPGVGKEELLAVDLVVGDGLLAFGGHQPVDELLAQFLL